MENQKKKELKKRGRPPGKANSKEPKTTKSNTSGAAAANKVLKKEDIPLVTKKQEEKDACDCFVAKCPGCWYPCETCGSTKCSTFCRTISRDEQLEWTFFN